MFTRTVEYHLDEQVFQVLPLTVDVIFISSTITI